MRFFTARPMADAPEKVSALVNTAYTHMINLEVFTKESYETIISRLESSGELWFIAPQKDFSPIYLDIELYENYLDDIIVAIREHPHIPLSYYKRFLRVVKKWWVFVVHVRVQGNHRMNKEFFQDLMSVYFAGLWDGYVNGEAEKRAIGKGMLIIDSQKINNITLKLFDEKSEISLSQYMLQHMKKDNSEPAPITNGIHVNIYELIQGDKIQSKANYKDLINSAKESSWNITAHDAIKFNKICDYLQFQDPKELVYRFSFNGWHFHVMYMTEPGYCHVMILANKQIFQQSIHRTFDQAYNEACLFICRAILMKNLSLSDVEVLLNNQFPRL